MNTGTEDELDRKQLVNVLAVALGNARSGERRPLSTYEPLAWLLADDVTDRATRKRRRVLYRKLVRELATEFDAIYQERLIASNGPWEFADVYKASGQAQKCIWRMRWCAFQHLLRLPGACTGSSEAYRRMMEVLRPAIHPSMG